MAKTYKQDLIRVSLVPEHWQALKELATDNRVTIGEMVSTCLESTLKQIIDEAEYISALERTSNP